ncbi:hypothetical protein ACUNV4_26430 [Granulosicoccus sp. 3-233]|uniref:hypothetical protein n=1 Tax=Granulosicoccus sp. 3-233 TaxID=3417969 RepID=UPI003D32CA6B
MNRSVSFQPPRKLRVFAFDPATGNRHANRRIREMTISIPWELDPIPRDQAFIGPDGEYLQIVDFDPASGLFYEPIDLNDPEVLHNNGLSPSEENPFFHQQMVYAVAMNTISVFERALGRVVLWAPRRHDPDHPDQDRYVGKLRVYPHALREANAFYDPHRIALLFGYFTAGRFSRSAPPDSVVFTCLSHDIVVHETCHAILDGMHPHYVENSNRDMLALHEAFADIVAVFQHFSHPRVLEDQIARTRGDLERQSLLGALAQEFGQAIGHAGALRDALGQYVDGKWQPREPDNETLDHLAGPHARGAILVAAVFRAFLSIYRARVADLLRIASGGSGILRDGEIDPDLVKRLAHEAATSAQHILRMCIRAMDYVPPVNVDFGCFLRAVITADHDLYPEDDYHYRRAFIEAFTAWGIVPEGTPVITERSLIWPEFREAAADHQREHDIDSLEADFRGLISRPDEIFKELKRRNDMRDNAGRELIRELESLKDRLVHRLQEKQESSTQTTSARRSLRAFSKNDVLQRNLLGSEFSNDRAVVFLAREFYSLIFWGIISGQQDNELLHMIGITLENDAPNTISRSEITGLPTFQVGSVRMANRVGKRGQTESEYVVEIIQSRDGFLDRQIQALADKGTRTAITRAWRKLHGQKPYRRDFLYRCGCTLLIDTKSFEIRRVIRTRYRADEDEGLERMRRFLKGSTWQARNAFDDPTDGQGTCNAFAELHRHVERGRF